MKIENVLILEQKDLIVPSINDVPKITDFNDLNNYVKLPIVLYIDDNGKTKILKNRYGYEYSR